MNSRSRPPRPRVVIVGGGLAGLAAASALVDKGLSLTILESRPRLGGRASSFTDPVTGDLVDNCQHVTMGCCTNLADLCERTGVRSLFRPLPALHFLEAEGRESVMKAGRLPAPLHLSGSLLRAHYLSWGDKLRVALGMSALLREKEGRAGESFEAWLKRHGQNDRTINRFWGPVVVSTLNESLDRADYGLSRKVFIDGFVRHRAGHVVEVPTKPLGVLYDQGIGGWLKRRGVEVKARTGVREVELDGEGAVRGVRLRTGEVVEADFVVVAVPFQRVLDLLPAEAAEAVPELAGVRTMQPSPITSLHLWFDRKVCPYPHAVVLDRLTQWVFDHSEMDRKPWRAAGDQYLQVVISASRAVAGLPKEETLALVMDDLAALWPEVRKATLLRSWVVTEHTATFSVPPGIERARPDQRTPIDGLILAGDWTDTGWPATMEGAVRSGYLAAETILNDLENPHEILKRDLPTSWLARLLVGPTGRRRPRKPRPRQAAPCPAPAAVP